DQEAALHFKLQQVRNDGSKGVEYTLTRAQTLVGKSEGELTFPQDAKMNPRHAILSIQDGKLFIEPLAESPAFFSLISPYRLREGDVIKMGKQSFQFHANISEIESAAASGIHIRDLASMLDKAPAEFLLLGAEARHCLIREEEVSWGRTNGTY